MSNPTTPFNWQMPTNTDLVTDLPADFEVFGQAVASSMADLLGGTSGQILSKATNADMDFTWINNDQGDITGVTATSPLTGGGTSGAITVGIQSASTSQSGAVQLSDSTSTTSSVLASTPTATKSAYDLAAAAVPKSTVTTAGDVIYATGSGAVTRLGIGTTGQVLTVNGGGTAPSWATPAGGGGMTLLSTTTLSGSSTNISVTTGYKDLKIIISGATANAGGSSFVIRPNNASNTCAYTGTKYSGNASALSFSTTEYELLAFGGSLETDSENAWMVDIFNYDQSTYVKAIQASGYWKQVYQGNTRRNAMDSGGGYYATTAITSVALSLIGGNTFTAGQVKIYGVN
jgi:hypothetical protein